MADLLWPIGELTSNDEVNYVAGDYYGVEAPNAVLPTDFDGFNEACAWTRRAESGISVEHTLYGLHNAWSPFP